MNKNLPQSASTNQTGRIGVTVLQQRLEREGWIFRRQDGDSDFGIDGEIEVVDRNNVTGRLIKCQIKSSKSIVFDKGETAVQVRVTTHNLWRATPLLTLLFHVDVSSESIYWTPALAHHPRPEAESLSIRFEETSGIHGSMQSLRDYLDSWFSVRSSEAILREIVPFHRIYERLLEEVDHYDDWTEMSDDEDEQFRLFYIHAQRLRLDVGLANTDLPTMDDWYMRNYGVWDSSYPLFWGTFSEAMKVMGPAYEEALQTMTKRLSRVDLTMENQEVWNFVKHRAGGNHVLHTVVDDRATNPKFHLRIEEFLKKRDALKYRFSSKKP